MRASGSPRVSGVRPIAPRALRYPQYAPVQKAQGGAANSRRAWLRFAAALRFLLIRSRLFGSARAGIFGRAHHHPAAIMQPTSATTPNFVKENVGFAGCVGFSGSRTLGAASFAALQIVACCVNNSAHVFTGCAAGADAAAVAWFGPRARVFSVSSGTWGTGPGAYAARSIACVRQVAQYGGLWASFPSAACPAGLKPSANPGNCFNGSGSGSWASLAFAAGLGLLCVVFLPAGIPAPAWLSPLGNGWYTVQAVTQTSLW